MLQIPKKSYTHYRADIQRFNQPLKWPNNDPSPKTPNINLQNANDRLIIYTEGYIEIQIQTQINLKRYD